MKITKNNLLKIILYCVSMFYLIGAIAHYFGLTIFPWFDGNLYSPYHDSIIAMASLALFVIIFIIAQNPKKYNKLIYGISLVALFIGLLTVYMTYSINWSQYSAVYKQEQSLIEGILLILLSGLLFILNKR